MNESEIKSKAKLTAHIVSDFFSPLLTPTYAMIVAMTLTRLHYLPAGVRLWTTLGVAAITALIPAVFILIMIRMGRVSDRSISDPKQRTLPYCVSILCYVGASFFLRSLSAPEWLYIFFMGAALTAAISMLITHWWKISAHSGGIGGLAGAIFWMGRNGVIADHALIWISIAILLAGIVAWARLYLRHHTVLQVFAGAVMAFFIEYSLLCFFR